MIGKPFIELSKVESTNNYAMALAHEGMAQHGTLVFTTCQTRGKGQRTKSWESEPGKNIAMSLVVDPYFLPASEAFRLSMMAAVAVHETLTGIIGEETKIKWPNDIYWRDRKAAGILIENIFQGPRWAFAVIGIGLNVNQTAFNGLQNAVSLKQITGKEHPLRQLAERIAASVENHYQLLQAQAPIIEDTYRAQLYKRGQQVRLKKDNRIFEAEIVDVTNQGQLVTRHGVEEHFNVGDVEWVHALPA